MAYEESNRTTRRTEDMALSQVFLVNNEGEYLWKLEKENHFEVEESV